jgi:gas vesicle protein
MDTLSGILSFIGACTVLYFAAQVGKEWTGSWKGWRQEKEYRKRYRQWEKDNEKWKEQQEQVKQQKQGE